MENKKISLTAKISISAIAVVSFANFFNLSLVKDIGFAGISILIGVISFFVVKTIEKQPFEGSGFNIRAIPKNLRSIKNCFWLITPIIWGVITLPIIIKFFPDAVAYDKWRAAPYITYDNTLMTVFMLFILALGEEIGMRAFLQNHLCRIMPVTSAIIITSVLFTAGHYAAGDITLVSMNLVSVFVLSVLYGMVFHKTKNAWISAFAHFLSNSFVLIIYGVI